jgi:repressor LexA
MSLAKKIKMIRNNAGMTQEEFGKVLGLSAMAVSQWENGRAKPRMGSLQKICDDFGVPMSDLLEEDPNPKSVFPKAISVTAPSVATVPLKTIGRVHAGVAMDEEEVEREVEVPASVYEHHPHAFALLVEGGCMDRVIPDGSHVLIDPDREPSNGSIAVVENEMHCAIMRRWYKGTSNLMLVPDSFGEYDDIVLSEEDGPIKVLGTVVWYQSADEMG